MRIHFRNRASLVLVCVGLALSTPANATTQEQADAAMAQSQWDEAIAAYRTILSDDPANAANWFNLGRAYFNTAQFEAARDAFETSIENGYQPAVQAQLFLARTLMSLGEKEKALALLEDIAAAGGPSHRTLLAIAEFQSLVDEPRFIQVIDILTPCNTQAYRQFDFWLGEWDVQSAGASAPTATNRITRQLDGCLILEEYQNGNFTGTSVNFYDAVREVWHQTWMSNAGGALYLEGGLNGDGAMEMSDSFLASPEGAGTINKITWTPNEDGTVRQFWQSSSDGGKTWATSFDGLYMRQSPAKE